MRGRRHQSLGKFTRGQNQNVRHRVSLRALAIVENGHVRDVALVIGRVEVLAVPAVGEVDASLESGLAACVGETITVVASLATGVAQARPLGRALLEFRLRAFALLELLGAALHVTGNHAETCMSLISKYH